VWPNLDLVNKNYQCSSGHCSTDTQILKKTQALEARFLHLIKQFLHKTRFCTLTALSRWILMISTGSVVRRDATTIVSRCSREETLVVISSSMVESHRCWGTNCGPSTPIGTRRYRGNHRACSQYCSCWGGGCRGLHRIAVPARSAGQPASAVSKHRVVSVRPNVNLVVDSDTQRDKFIYFVFQFLMTISVNSINFWDLTTCNPVQVPGYFNFF
jgi:hypothetical protein